MPAVIPFIPLIVGGATAATTVYSLHKQGQLADEQIAAQQQIADKQLTGQQQSTLAQLQSARDASNFQRQGYNDRLQALSPYRNSGSNAFSSLAGSFGLNPTASLGGQPKPAEMLPPVSPLSVTPVSSGMVRLQSPDGQEMKDVPATQLDFWLGKGARQVS